MFIPVSLAEAGADPGSVSVLWASPPFYPGGLNGSPRNLSGPEMVSMALTEHAHSPLVLTCFPLQRTCGWVFR